MIRVLLAGVLGCVGACAATRDIYVGSDVSDAAVLDPAIPDARSEPERDAAEPRTPTAGSGPIAGAPAPPVACAAERGDCDGLAANGCEIDLSIDPNHCGRCGNRCDTPDCVCRGGRFAVACPAGRANCDGADENGCESDIANSLQHCGACDRACHTNGHDAIAAVCSAGRCQITCQVEAFPEGDCDGQPDNGCETSLWSDDNCGACGVQCRCVNGTCG